MTHEAAHGVTAEIERALRDALAADARSRSATTATCTPAMPAPAKAGISACASVSARFAGLSRVARHRLVYDALRPLIAAGHPRAGHRGPHARRGEPALSPSIRAGPDPAQRPLGTLPALERQIHVP